MHRLVLACCNPSNPRRAIAWHARPRERKPNTKTRPTKLTWSSLRRRNRNSFHVRASHSPVNLHWCLQAPRLPLHQQPPYISSPTLRSMLALQPPPNPPNPKTVRRSNPRARAPSIVASKILKLRVDCRPSSDSCLDCA